MKELIQVIGIVGFIALVLFLIVFAPFASIWALNTLFPALAIPYTFNTWLAVIVFNLFIRGNGLQAKRENQ